jgi:hypothetical protein
VLDHERSPTAAQECRAGDEASLPPASACSGGRPGRTLADRADEGQDRVVLFGVPAQLEQAFTREGIRVVETATVPQLCDRTRCGGVDLVWGRGLRTVLRPRAGRPDFAVVVVTTHANAVELARVFRRNPAVGATVRRSSVLLYLRTSPRLARLRAAFSR